MDSGPEIDEERRRQRLDFLQSVADNDARLWFITRYSIGNTEFPEDQLDILYKYKERAQKLEYLPTSAEESEYQGATMAAARYIGARRPETIREFAEVQRGTAKTPNKVWLWLLGIFLLFALLIHGYNISLTRQIVVMRADVTAYVKESQKLLTVSEDVGMVLATMCQQTLSYRTAATQLSHLIFWESDEVTPESNGATSASQDPIRPGICGVLSKAIGESALPGFPADGGPQKNDNKAWTEYRENTAAFRHDAVNARLTTDQSRNLISVADTVAEFLNLLIVPCLFALLGSLTSVLRTANARMKDMTLTRVDNAGLIVKVLLGLVAGGSVSIVFSSSGDLAESAGLTQIGLAFAVGYAVDIFFNLLDGVRTGLGSRPEQVQD